MGDFCYKVNWKVFKEYFEPESFLSNCRILRLFRNMALIVTVSVIFGGAFLYMVLSDSSGVFGRIGFWATLVYFLLFFVASLQYHNFKLKSIYSIKAMVNDLELIKLNFGNIEPIPESHFQIIAYKAKTGEEPTHKDSKFYSSSKSIRKTINRLDKKGILKPWKFELLNIEKDFEKEKEKFERNLGYVWGLMLKHESGRVK